MKKLTIILFSILISAVLSSCNKDFLEKPPGVDVTEDVIFSSVNQTETFVASTYEMSIPTGYPVNYDIERRLNGSILGAACDEAETVNVWSNAQNWNTGAIPSNNIKNDEDDRVDLRWQAIRKCNILLERIGTVPDASPSYKDQVKGEALFIRALLYFETVKRYGGVPIVSKRLNPDDQILQSRNSLEECFNFIIADCDAAIALLPASMPSNLVGRATKGAALALKSRTLLYAASPIFNTATPYIDFGANNKLICFGNYDKSRWQKAADAAKATLDWAASSNCSLVTKYGADRNYEMVWSEADNPEIILANKKFNGWNRSEKPFAILIPGWAGSGWPDGGMSVPLNFVKYYEKKDGNKQDWNMNGGDDLLKKYADLDPRFNQTITAHGAVWNTSIGKISLFGPPHTTYCLGGHWLRKLVPRDVLPTGSAKYLINWIVFRLGEVYLNYAEALNEAQGPVEDAYTAVDVVRERSGMPKLKRGMSQDELREHIRNERAVELAYEEHRFWDIRRWLIADQPGVMQGPFYGLKVSPVQGNTAEAHYQPYVFETRVWNKREYLHPFPSIEMFKGYLTQNPGW